MATYSNEFEQIRDAIASIWRDYRARFHFRIGKKEIPNPPGDWYVGEWSRPPGESRIVFWAPWENAYIVVRYCSERDKWWANYYAENTFREAIRGGELLNLSTKGYDCSYEDAIEAALDFMHGDHSTYPEDQPIPE